MELGHEPLYKLVEKLLAGEIVLPDIAADRLLNGPTSDVWINPWLKYLQERGVVYHSNADVRAIRCEHGVVRSATVGIGNRLQGQPCESARLSGPAFLL